MDPTVYEFNRAKLARLARSFGVASIVSLIFFASYFFIPMGFGALAILFAYLSTGYGNRKDGNITAARILGSISLVSSALVVILSFSLLFLNKDIQEAVIDYAGQLDEMYALDGTDESIQDMIEKFLGGTGK